MGNKTILFLNNLIWKPELPNFRKKYEVLSEYYESSLLHFSGEYRRTKHPGFEFISMPYWRNAIKRYVRYSLFALRFAKGLSKVDYIITYDPSIFGLIGLLVRTAVGGKLVVEVNLDHLEGVSLSQQGMRRRLKKVVLISMMRFVLKRADAVKFINTELYNKYKTYFRFRESTVFFSFISTHVFKKTGASHENYILFVGHPFNIKGVDVLIKAFNQLSDDFAHIRLKIVGHCEDMERYKTLANGNRRIEFHSGMDYDKIIPEFEGCKLFVLPSRSESMGRVLLEAMACGKPVIGSAVGGIPEIIKDGVNGFLFESENCEMLAERIRRVLADDELAARMGEAGYRTAAERYSPERYAALYHAFLSSL